MAEVLGVREGSLKRWQWRQTAVVVGPAPKRGRPVVIPLEVRMQIRTQYLAKHFQWGPRVLAAWVRRQGWGHYSADTIAKILHDLQPPKEPHEPKRRIAMTAPQVMWSEDGAGFKERFRKKELLILQDEASRFKVNIRLVDGPAKSRDVIAYLQEAFEHYGPPLVLKHDGGSIFQDDAVEALLNEHHVVSLTSPPHYPPFNGKMERTVRDIKGYEQALKTCHPDLTLSERLAEAVRDLNDERPRPILGGRTAKEVYEQDRIPLIERKRFHDEVLQLEQTLLNDATSRQDQRRARQQAVEAVLLHFRYMKEITDVSTYFEAKTWTN